MPIWMRRNAISKSIGFDFLMSISVTWKRTLSIPEASAPGSRPFLSAASGLLKVAEEFYVVSDDSLHLAIFSQNSNVPGRLVRLFTGDLPEHPVARKKVKPDLEILLQLPAFPGYPEGAIFAIPSGSKENRTKAALIPLPSQRILGNDVLEVDFSQLYEFLSKEIPDLNLEGAIVYQNQLLLFQRGNSESACNAIVHLELVEFLKELSATGRISARSFEKIQSVELGEIKGVAFGFTDAALCGDEVWFLAAAENTKSTYTDGVYIGSLLGKLAADLTVVQFYALDCPFKPEGLWLEKDGDKTNFYLVTDSDNASIASNLYLGVV